MNEHVNKAQAIPFGRPMLSKNEIDRVTKVLSGSTLVHGPVTRDFELRFAERMGAKRAVSVSSCTSGLHLSLLVNGLQPDEEVIVPAMTHVATAHVVEFCGAKPVFVDVEGDTGNLSVDTAEDAYGDRTRAIMPVHYLGLPCDMEPLMHSAEKIGAFIVEDCALAIDATYNGKKVGNFGATGCFSFYPTKHMTTIEGGMVTTNDDTVADSITQRKAFGYDRSLGQRKTPGVYDVTALGYNMRMNEVQAAIGLEQLAQLDEFQRRRAENFDRLQRALSTLDEVTVFEDRKNGARSSHYCLNATLPRDGSISREAVVAHLRAAEIGTSVHYPKAVPLLDYYAQKYGFREGQFPNAEWIAAQTISLPIGPHVDANGIDRIADEFKKGLRSAV